MPNLEILSLSVNKINSLKEFANCTRLQELYVRKNNIGDLNEVFYLGDLEDLKVLWLCENPCAENSKFYREFVINALPNLENLDKIPITAEERAAASRMNFDVQEPRRVQTENSSPPIRKTENAEYESNQSKKNGNYGTPNAYPANDNNYNSSPYQEVSDYQQQYPSEVVSERENFRPSTSPTKGEKRGSPDVVRNSINSNNLKNENIISAILILMKDLDDAGLRIIRRDIDKKIAQ